MGCKRIFLNCTIILTYLDMQEESTMDTTGQRRIARLLKMIQDEKHQMLQKVKRIQEDALSSKKHKEFRETLEQRIAMVDRFIEEISTTFFLMLSDREFLSLTTEIDLVEKIDKFKKNLFNSLQKLTVNLWNRNESFWAIPDKPSQRSKLNKKKLIAKRGKNAKMSNETSVVMTEWLLRNFQNPYPTTQEKLKMSRQSSIEVTQVNNWFINARERTIKGYFTKDQ